MSGSRILRSTRSRLSNSTLSLRWKYGPFNLMKLIAWAVGAMLFMLLVIIQQLTGNKITIQLNGHNYVYFTEQETVQQFLSDRQIKVSIFDSISVPLTSRIEHNMSIVIDQSVPIYVFADGVRKKVYTSKETIGDALSQSKIKLGINDIVTPKLSDEIATNLEVKIVRVTKEITNKEVPIPFETVKEKDYTIPKGDEKVLDKGKEGVLVEKYESVFHDGVLISRSIVSKVTKNPPTDRIILVGVLTEEEIAARNNIFPAQKFKISSITVQAQKVLKNVTLTAYTAGFRSTGKRPGDKGYGRTASGTIVQQGRTIAVDTRIIPMGWWVYIDGMGLYRAEDRGGAVKGNKIDIYFVSEYQALKFGRRKGYTVYVIGPNKPKVL